MPIRIFLAAALPMLFLLADVRSLHAQPSEVSYQGELKKDGLPFTGTAQMKFVIVAGDGESIWSNDGTSTTGSEPTASVNVDAENGIFSIRLGAAPMEPISGGLLKGVTEVALRVWVNTGGGFEQLTDQPISSSTFSLSGEKCLEIGAVQINVVPRWDGSALVPGTLFDDGNNVGVGTNAPTTKLDVSGTVRSSNGGFQFPDGSSMTTAVTGGGGGVPSGAMILTDGLAAPTGYHATGLTMYVAGTNQWRRRKDIPTARYALSAVGVAGKLYAIGGDNGGGDDELVYEYEPSANTWQPRSNMPFGRKFFAAVEVGGVIYVIGGITIGGPPNSVLRYDPQLNSWSEVAPLPTSRNGLVAATHGGKIYAIGGRRDSDNSLVAEVEVFDPATNNWEQLEPMLTPRADMAAGTVGDQIVVAGGYGEASGPTAIVEAYSPLNDTWTSLENMPSTRSYFSAVAIANRLYCLGGCDWTHCAIPVVDIYDVGAATWTQAADMSIGRYSHASSSVNGRVYSVGGFGASGYLPILDEFVPPVQMFVHEKD